MTGTWRYWIVERTSVRFGGRDGRTKSPSYWRGHCGLLAVNCQLLQFNPNHKEAFSVYRPLILYRFFRTIKGI